MKEKIEELKKLYKYLQDLEIKFKTISHPEVISCEESKKYYDLKGMDERKYGLCKNILIRDKKGKNFWLVILDFTKNLDLELLRNYLKSSKLGLATIEDLDRLLKSKPGSVSLFSLFNDDDKKIKVIFDQDLTEKEVLAFHPNYNRLTSFITWRETIRFLFNQGYSFSVLKMGENIKESVLTKKI